MKKKKSEGDNFTVSYTVFICQEETEIRISNAIYLNIGSLARITSLARKLL